MSFILSNDQSLFKPRVPTAAPEGTIINDVNWYFAQLPNGIYYMSRAINLAAMEIKKQTGPGKPKSHARLILTHVLAQAIPFRLDLAFFRGLQVKV